MGVNVGNRLAIGVGNEAAFCFSWSNFQRRLHSCSDTNEARHRAQLVLQKDVRVEIENDENQFENDRL